MQTSLGPAVPSVGASPGVEHDELALLPEGPERVRVTCVDYGPGNLLVEEVDDLEDFVERHRAGWTVVRWINVDGLTDMRTIHTLATEYELHPLAVEDLLHLRQRPKVDAYGGDDSTLRARLFIVARTLEVKEESLLSQQISIFLGHNTVLTFQESPSHVWDPIGLRLQTRGSRLRANDASFLVYSFLDVIVDHFFPILESYGERMDQLETSILEGAQRNVLDQVHQIKRDLLLARSVAWSTREMVMTLQREQHECVSEVTQVYLRDLYDHVVQIIEIIETYRERASDLTDSYMSGVSNRMNEIMKVLTIISTLFIPLTFLAGVYGMNFRHFPELDVDWAYPAFWVLCVTLAGVMLLLFRRRGWL